MSELQAALGLHVLDLVESEKTKRGRIRQIYRDRFQAVPGLELLELPNNATDSRQYCIALINEGQAGKNRDYVVERLKDWNIFARRYFHPLCSDMPHYRHLSSTAKDCLSNARKAANEVISLPYYGRLEDEDVHRICDVLIHILEDAG
jgi:dTDP-4-amino-4,6-dideoxygalactose transaminase